MHQQLGRNVQHRDRECRPLFERGGRELRDRIAAKGSLAVERLVERDAEGELVTAGIDPLARELFRRHVSRGSHGGQRLRGIGSRITDRLEVDLLASRPGQSEVEDAGSAFAVDHHVVGLEVAMDHAGAVGRRETGSGREVHPKNVVGGAPLLTLPVGEGDAVDELHRDEDLAVVDPDVVHRDHVRVRELGEGPRLLEQSVAIATGLPAIGRGAALEELDRDLAIELRVVGREHHAHTSGAQPLQDDVPTDRLPSGDDSIAFTAGLRAQSRGGEGGIQGRCCGRVVHQGLGRESNGPKRIVRYKSAACF